MSTSLARKNFRSREIARKSFSKRHISDTFEVFPFARLVIVPTLRSRVPDARDRNLRRATRH